MYFYFLEVEDCFCLFYECGEGEVCCVYLVLWRVCFGIRVGLGVYVVFMWEMFVKFMG